MDSRIETMMNNGVEVQVENIPIVSSSEHFCEYLLEDGSILRIKHVMLWVKKVVNQLLPDGTPLYIYRHQDVTDVIANKPAKS